MGRLVMYLVIVALGIFVLVATFLVEGGGKSTATIGMITVEDLVTQPDRYGDREIATRGTLQYDEADGTYYVSDSVERLRLVYEPGGIDDLIETDVRVTGRLLYDDAGVYIDADRVRPTEV
jgi:hypothetical protein